MQLENKGLTGQIGEEQDPSCKPWPWTRERWDAAREAFWYMQNNRFLSHIRNSVPLGRKFIDFAMFLTVKANGPFKSVAGKGTKIDFANCEPDQEYLMAQQVKELSS
jgi:hypothetical protein